MSQYMIYKFCNGLAPTYLSSKLVKNLDIQKHQTKSKDQLRVPRCRIATTQHAFLCGLHELYTTQCHDPRYLFLDLSRWTECLSCGLLSARIGSSLRSVKLRKLQSFRKRPFHINGCGLNLISRPAWEYRRISENIWMCLRVFESLWNNFKAKEILLQCLGFPCCCCCWIKLDEPCKNSWQESVSPRFRQM